MNSNKFVFEIDTTNVYDYKVSIQKDMLSSYISNPKLELVFKDNAFYSNEEVYKSFLRIGYFVDGNDIDDPIRNSMLLKTLFEYFNLTILRDNNKISFNLPFISILYGLETTRIRSELIFYLILDKESDLYKNIDNIHLYLDFNQKKSNSDDHNKSMHEICDIGTNKSSFENNHFTLFDTNDNLLFFDKQIQT